MWHILKKQIKENFKKIEMLVGYTPNFRPDIVIGVDCISEEAVNGKAGDYTRDFIDDKMDLACIYIDLKDLKEEADGLKNFIDMPKNMLLYLLFVKTAAHAYTHHLFEERYTPHARRLAALNNRETRERILASTNPSAQELDFFLRTYDLNLMAKEEGAALWVDKELSGIGELPVTMPSFKKTLERGVIKEAYMALAAPYFSERIKSEADLKQFFKEFLILREEDIVGACSFFEQGLSPKAIAELERELKKVPIK